MEQNMYNRVIVTESEIQDLLGDFNSEYVLDMIDNTLDTRFDYSTGSIKPNLAKVFATKFNIMLMTYPTEKALIQSTMRETMVEILNRVCEKSNLAFVDTDSVDYITLSSYVYGVFASQFKECIELAYTNYIKANLNEIYKTFGLDSCKKVLAKIYNLRDVDEEQFKLLAVVYKLQEILPFIASQDIPLAQLLMYMFNNDSIVRMFYDNIQVVQEPNNTLYRHAICNSPLGSNILTDMQLNLNMTANPSNQIDSRFLETPEQEVLNSIVLNVDQDTLDTAKAEMENSDFE